MASVWPDNPLKYINSQVHSAKLLAQTMRHLLCYSSIPPTLQIWSQLASHTSIHSKPTPWRPSGNILSSFLGFLFIWWLINDALPPSYTAAKTYRIPYLKRSGPLNLDSVHMNVAHLSTPLCNVAVGIAQLVLIHWHHRRRQGLTHAYHPTRVDSDGDSASNNR